MVEKAKTVDLGTLVIDANKAKAFAQAFDPNPVHVSDCGNELLPKGAVSGLYLACLVNTLILNHPAFTGIVCAKSMVIKWLRPITEGSELTVCCAFRQIGVNQRSNTFLYESICKISDEMGKLKAEIIIEHLLRA